MNSASGMNVVPNDSAPSSDCNIQQADFELQKLEDGRWRLRANTRHGLNWMRSLDMERGDGELHLTLMRANDFLRKARHHGLKTEYMGPMGRSVL